MNSSNQTSSEMEYIKHLNRGFFIIIAVLHVTTIFFTFHVIWCSKFVKKSAKLDRISNSFFIFLASRGFGAVFALPYYVYLITLWLAGGGIKYEPYALLWLGLGMIIHTYLSTVSASLLTLERCFALTFPMHYTTRIKKCFPWVTLTCYILWSIFLALNVLREIPLDIEKMHSCQAATCVLIKYRMLVPQYAKFFMGGLNVLGSCYLVRAMKWNKKEKLKNDVVKFTTAMDMFLDVIPILANSILVSMTGFSPFTYTGQLLSFLIFFNVAACSVYYSWRLTRRSNGFWVKIRRVEQVSSATTITQKPITQQPPL